MSSLHTTTSTHTASSSASSTVVATPIAPPPLTAQESREKRYARQQARYRDRGGIFVPQQRTALRDVLLGVTTLNKVFNRRSKSRSASCSPVRRRVGNEVEIEQDTAVVLSRAKKGRKSVAPVAEEQSEPIAGPSKKVTKAAATLKGRKKAESKPRGKKVAMTKPTDDSGASTTSRRPRKSTAPAPKPSLLNSEAETESPTHTKSTKNSTRIRASTTTRGRGKAKPVLPQDSEDNVEDTAAASGEDEDAPIVSKKGKSKATDKVRATPKLKPKLTKSASVRSRNTKRPEPDSTSDIEQSNNVNDSDFPSSPLARRTTTKRRAAAAKAKPYVESEDEPEQGQGKPVARGSKKVTGRPQAKAKADSASLTNSTAQNLQPLEVTPKGSGKRVKKALSPVFEESEPDSDMENEEAVARSSRELAAAISATIEDFHPVSRDRGKKKKGEPKDATGSEEVGQVATKGKTTGKGTKRGAAGRSEASGSIHDAEEPISRASNGGKGLKNKRLDDSSRDAAALPSAQVSSPPRPLKRARAVPEPELIDDSPAARTRKKAKVVADINDVPAAPPRRSIISTTKSTKSKPAPLEEKVLEPDSRDAAGNAYATERKRKRAAIVLEEEKEPSLEPEPKKKKVLTKSTKESKEEPSDSPSRPRLKIASRKRKENAAKATSVTTSKPASAVHFAEDQAVPSRPAGKAKKAPATRKPLLSKAKGPPQSVLNRIKKSRDLHSVNDEPDELDFLS